MFPRIALFTTLILSLVLLPGCPGAAAVVVGTWTITINGVTSADLTIQADGTAVSIPLTGTFTWNLDGTRVLLEQVHPHFSRVWSAELTSDTTMDGANVLWKGSTSVSTVGDSQTFTGVKT